MSCYFAKISVHLLVIAAVCYFNVYKLKVGAQQTFTCLKLTGEALKNGVIYVQSYQ